MASDKLPYRVWSADRSKKKSLVAADLKECLEKAKEKLNIPEEKPVTLVLEEDGTEIDDDDYLKCLQPNTVFLLLEEQELWHPPGFQSQDEIDSKSTEEAESSTIRSPRKLTALLRDDMANIITFSNNEMQVIIDIDMTELKSLLGPKGSEAHSIQESCQRHLDDRERTIDAMQLLKMVNKTSQSVSDSHSATFPKRKKTES